MVNAYKMIGSLTDDSSQLNTKIISSIVIYLTMYRDTSISKQERLKGLGNASKILEHLVMDLNDNMDEESRRILHYGFLKILTKVKEAEMKTDILFDFNNELGFLRVLV